MSYSLTCYQTELYLCQTNGMKDTGTSLKNQLRKKTTFSLYIGIMKHCDEICALALAKRLVVGYLLLLLL